jgi:hypothetical protein
MRGAPGAARQTHAGGEGVARLSTSVIADDDALALSPLVHGCQG